MNENPERLHSAVTLLGIFQEFFENSQYSECVKDILASFVSSNDVEQREKLAEILKTLLSVTENEGVCKKKDVKGE